MSCIRLIINSAQTRKKKPCHRFSAKPAHRLSADSVFTHLCICYELTYSKYMSISACVRPGASVKGCQFHLGQAMWHKIQELELSKIYLECDIDTSKWLFHTFMLAYLDPQEVEDSFNTGAGIIQDLLGMRH